MSQEFPTNLFFEARDRADLRPAEYFHTARAPRPDVDAATARLREEAERRSRLMGRAIRDLEQAARAIKQLRDMDFAGFGDTWIEYADAVWGRASASFKALLGAVDAAYERHDEDRDRASVGRDPEPVGLEATVVEIEGSCHCRQDDNTNGAEAGEDPAGGEAPSAALGPGGMVFAGGSVQISPVHVAPTPADLAQQIARQQRAIALGGSFL